MKKQAQEHIRKLAQWAALVDFEIAEFKRRYLEPKEPSK